MTPRMMAQAYYIRAFCEPNEWNVTLQDIADHTGYAPNRIGRILRAKGWNTRIRSSVMDFQGIDLSGLKPQYDLVGELT